jgi:hypothetical protein
MSALADPARAVPVPVSRTMVSSRRSWIHAVTMHPTTSFGVVNEMSNKPTQVFSVDDPSQPLSHPSRAAREFGLETDDRVSMLRAIRSVLIFSRLLGFFPFKFVYYDDGRMDVRFSVWWLLHHAVLYAVVHGYGFVVYLTSNISLSKTGHYSFRQAVHTLFTDGERLTTVRWSNFDRLDPKMGVFLQSTQATPCGHVLI